MGVAVKAFGEFGGKPVRQFTLSSAEGVEIDIIEYGGSVRDWRVPVAGGTRSVVLGFEEFAPYPLHSPYLGSFAGPVANRIGGAEFSIGGKVFKLDANTAPDHLHGGAHGLGVRVWDGEADDANTAVTFRTAIKDGEIGYPGNVSYEATYRLVGRKLRLDLSAITDAVTPINLVQHIYFNLGTGADVLDHKIRVASSAYTETSAALIPTGNILETAPGSDRHLRALRTMRRADGTPIPYDDNYVLDDGRDLGEAVAEVVSPDGALTLKLWTDQRGVQVYNGVMTDVPVPGNGGKRYGHHSGFCLEDQAFPDALHHPHFPSIWYGPDRPYAHWCEIEIG